MTIQKNKAQCDGVHRKGDTATFAARYTGFLECLWHGWASRWPGCEFGAPAVLAVICIPTGLLPLLTWHFSCSLQQVDCARERAHTLHIWLQPVIHYSAVFALAVIPAPHTHTSFPLLESPVVSRQRGRVGCKTCWSVVFHFLKMVPSTCYTVHLGLHCIRRAVRR